MRRVIHPSPHSKPTKPPNRAEESERPKLVADAEGLGNVTEFEHQKPCSPRGRGVSGAGRLFGVESIQQRLYTVFQIVGPKRHGVLPAALAGNLDRLAEGDDDAARPRG